MKRLARAIALTGAVLAVTAPEAPAAATRAEYAAQANAICIQTNQAVKSLAKTFSRQQKKVDRAKDLKPKQQARFVRGFARFNKRTAALEAAEFTQLITITPAPGDESLVSLWLKAHNDLRKANKRLNELFVQLFKVVPLDDPEDEGKTPKKAKKLFGKLFGLLFRSLELSDQDYNFGAGLGVNNCVSKPDDIFGGKTASSTAARYLLP